MSTEESETTIQLEAKKVFSLDMVLSTPIIAGSKVIYGIEGTATGKIQGKVVSPSSDWLTMKADGSLHLQVQLLIQTDDGANIFSQISGRAVRTEDDPTKAAIKSVALFETNAEDYKWLNTKVLLGHGYKEGNILRVDYYETL